ncbi:tripartite tricarboxylate transporter substrate binding protein [Achromobacter sp. GG226]|uniref:Bug family tripartite tricarboxylate transporter substrate binding protein n=1 Tax=Verticiella alkaliphila TaxID=2779529 RepID=UPI001C0E16A1|nr:tripartite tricarboxylate transporter substrate binding protein [Verticiella sp. GG226]MBU4611866.1 tripartite tricarboxylate transporter substrate binding protein [Verticiella sp. GG226]
MFSMTSRPRETRRLALSLLAGALCAIGLPTVHAAESYPNKPIRVIVGLPPGGATDILARLLAEKMAPALGQTMLVENRPGAGAIIGTDAVAKAAPDGYTISLILSNAVIANQFLYSQLPYDPGKDIAYIYQLVDAAVVLAATAEQPFQTAPQFAAYAQANPGKLTYGSYSPGSYGHVAMAYLDDRLKSQMTHVGYKGEAPMLQDMLGGRVDVAFGSAVNMTPHVQSGKLKFLGVTGPRRMSVLPDVPTLVEQGLTDEPFKVFGWAGLIAPAGTPRPILDRLASETRKVLADPDVQQRIRALGFEPVLDSSPQKTRARYDADVPIWKKLVEASGAKIQ